MRLALVPLLVPRSALPSAIGLVAMSFNIARILGPAMCAAIIAQWGRLGLARCCLHFRNLRRDFDNPSRGRHAGRPL